MAGQTGVRERRLACGLTQAELATRAGVSRQLVAAVEGERHAPAVDAALGIARALGTTVEELFTAQRVQVTPAMGGQFRDGALLRIGKVESRLVAAESPDHGIIGPVWAKPDGVVEHGQVRLLPGGIPAGFVVAGCDPALGVAEAMLACTGPLSLLSISAPTGRALKALQEGGVHAAAVHGRADDMPEPPVKVARWHVAKWHVGLAFTRHRKSPTVEAALRSKAPIIQRDSSASSQDTLVRAAKSVGIDSLPAGPHAAGHLEAARLAQFTGGTAVTIEAGARAFDLDFIPLEEHVVELWVNERWRDHPGLVAFGEVLTTAAFIDRVALFGGYDLTQCGDRITEAA